MLSGILPSQANAVIAAYRPLALEQRIDLDGWTTLVFIAAPDNTPLFAVPFQRTAISQRRSHFLFEHDVAESRFPLFRIML